MRIDKTELIAGQPILGIRNFLRSIGDNGFTELEIALRFRNIPGRDPIRYNEERARQSGRRFGSWLEMVGYGENEVHRLLKQRSPHISLHPLSDIAATASESKVVFVAEPEK